MGLDTCNGALGRKLNTLKSSGFKASFVILACGCFGEGEFFRTGDATGVFLADKSRTPAASADSGDCTFPRAGLPVPLGITGTLRTGLFVFPLLISEVSNKDECIGLGGLTFSEAEVLEPNKDVCSLCKVDSVSCERVDLLLEEVVDILTVVATIADGDDILFSWSKRIRGGGALIKGGGTLLTDLAVDKLGCVLPEAEDLGASNPCCSISFCTFSCSMDSKRFFFLFGADACWGLDD